MCNEHNKERDTIKRVKQTKNPHGTFFSRNFSSYDNNSRSSRYSFVTIQNNWPKEKSMLCISDSDDE